MNSTTVGLDDAAPCSRSSGMLKFKRLNVFPVCVYVCVCVCVMCDVCVGGVCVGGVYVHSVLTVEGPPIIEFLLSGVGGCVVV